MKSFHESQPRDGRKLDDTLQQDLDATSGPLNACRVSDEGEINAASSTPRLLFVQALDGLIEPCLRAVEEQLQSISDDGLRARVVDGVAARMPGILEELSDRLVDEILESSSPVIEGRGALGLLDIEGSGAHWDDALGTFRLLWAGAHETGEAFSLRHFNVVGYEPPSAIHAQVGLQARACRVALEVFVLLRSGLGAGALARARTIHEIAVVSTLLAENGGADGEHPDLADRYLLHSTVLTWLDAQEFQSVAPRLGYAPFTDEEMAEMRAEFDEAVEIYGTSFGKPNGWAACLTSNGKPPAGFKALELLAGSDHMRSYYSMASHEVHADAKSWVLNHERVGDVTFRSTGPSLRGMADAAQIALIALNQVTVNMLNAAPDIDEHPADVLAILVLNKLTDHACNRFASADATHPRGG